VRRLRMLLCAIAPVCVLAMPAVAPADDFFLQVEGVPGDSTDAKFQRAIEVESFSWGVGNGDHKIARFTDFTFSKVLDRSSPRLMQLVASNQVVPTATLTARKSGLDQQQYLRLCFSGVQFTGSHLSGSDGSGLPRESVSFSYATVVERFTPQKEDGSLDTPVFGGWDLVRNLQFGGNC
jgi:type VI secretion system secreted protein Hcp